MTEKHCEKCHPGMPTLSKAETEAALKDISGWQYDEKRDVIFKSYDFKGFYKTMAFVNAIAWIVQNEGHHPDMQVGYSKVEVAFTTHEAGGITTNDLICAEKVEALN